MNPTMSPNNLSSRVVTSNSRSMAALLWRDETINGIPGLKKIKESHISGTVVYNGITYEVNDPSKINVILPDGDTSVRVATFSDPNYSDIRGFSNGIIWNGEAYFASRGSLCALNLNTFVWRDVITLYHRGAPILENSTANDLLLLTNEENGTVLFTRFRPSLDDCKFVINYGYRMHIPGQSSEEIRALRNLCTIQDICMHIRQDGIFTIPRKWWNLLNGEGISERRIPDEIMRVIAGIYNGTHAYPRSEIEATQLWKPSTVKSRLEQEIIDQLRARESKDVYSRHCPVCYVSDPELRAVLIECGHICCLACTMQLAKKCNHVICPLCRKNSKFIRIYEAGGNRKEVFTHKENGSKLD